MDNRFALFAFSMVLLTLLVFTMPVLASTPGEIDSCQTLDTEGTYFLNQSIETTGTCFTITANNVVLDGNGFNVTSDASMDSSGVYSLANNLTVKNLTLDNFDRGISVEQGTNLNITNNTIYNSASWGVFMTSITDSFFSGNKLIDSAVSGIYVQTSESNTFSNNNLSGSGADCLIYLTIQSRHNVIRDSVFSSTDLCEIGLDDDSSYNNVFLNVTYNLTKEDVGLSSELIRKWYLDVSVNDSLNSLLQTANVSAYNVSNALQFSALTGSNGQIERQEVIEYVNNGVTRNYYSNYTINASKSGFVTNSTTLNLTDNSAVHFTLTDSSAPIIVIVSPTATTYTTNSYLINITLDEQGDCNYSLNNGLTNQTLTNSGNISFSTTKSAVSDGSYILYAYCIDLYGNEGSSNVSFIVNVPDSTDDSSGSSGSSGGGGSSFYSVDLNQMISGKSYGLYSGDGLSFSIDNGSGLESHRLKLNSILSGAINLTVYSSPINLLLSVGQEKKLSLINEGYYDLYLKLESITGSRANITIKSINEPVLAGSSDSDSILAGYSNSSNGGLINNFVENAGMSKYAILIYSIVIIISILVLAICIYLLIFKENIFGNKKN